MLPKDVIQRQNWYVVRPILNIQQLYLSRISFPSEKSRFSSVPDHHYHSLIIPIAPKEVIQTIVTDDHLVRYKTKVLQLFSTSLQVNYRSHNNRWVPVSVPPLSDATTVCVVLKHHHTRTLETSALDLTIASTRRQKNHALNPTKQPIKHKNLRPFDGCSRLILTRSNFHRFSWWVLCSNVPCYSVNQKVGIWPE